MPLEQLVSTYGIAGLFLGAAAEGEAVAMMGGVLAHRGLVGLQAAVLAVAAGSFLVDQIFFLLGRRFRQHPRVRAVQESAAGARALAIFARRPALFAFGFRFLYGLRVASAVMIGATGYPWPRMLALNAASALLWAVIFVSLGYASGGAIARIFGHLEAERHYPLALAVIAATVACLALVAHRQRRDCLRKRQNGRSPGQ